MIATCLDITNTVSLLPQFSFDPSETHLKPVKCVLQYLKGTNNFRITYKNIDLNPVGFYDTDWAGNLSDKKSISSYIFLIAGGAVASSSTDLSSTEAEYVAMPMQTNKISGHDTSLQHWIDGQMTNNPLPSTVIARMQLNLPQPRIPHPNQAHRPGIPLHSRHCSKWKNPINGYQHPK
jgi:hypothetical protein